jgi:peptidyl-prolyl cis-trans isomerase C
MDVTVNGKVIDAAAVGRAAARFSGSANPAAAAARMLVTRSLLLERARELGVGSDDEEVAIETVLDREVKVPAASDAVAIRDQELL